MMPLRALPAGRPGVRRGAQARQVDTEASPSHFAGYRLRAGAGLHVKLLAIAKSEEGAIEARVHPTMVPSRHLLASVGGAYNAIYIQGEALGSTMYFGLGAGEMPTATAVVADILEAARMRLAAPNSPQDHALGYPFVRIKAAKSSRWTAGGEYYLRFMAEDKPGVLGRIASCWAIIRYRWLR